MLTLGALLAVVVALNAAGGWSAAREEARMQAVPAALGPGQAVLGYRNVDERRFQRARLGVITRPQVVVFGSSRVMQIVGALVGVGPTAFYNLGMSGATVEDYVGLWEVLRRQDKIPERAILHRSLDLQRRGGVGPLARACPRDRHVHGGPRPHHGHRDCARRLEPRQGARVL
jgi:hypothetical protein